MNIRVDYNKLGELSSRLRRIELDIADISAKITKLSVTEAQSARHRNTEYYVKRACERVIASSNEVTSKTRKACQRISDLSRQANSAVNSYKEADTIERINAISYVGPSLRNIFNYEDYWSHVSTVKFDVRRFL